MHHKDATIKKHVKKTRWTHQTYTVSPWQMRNIKQFQHTSKHSKKVREKVNCQENKPQKKTKKPQKISKRPDKAQHISKLMIRWKTQHHKHVFLCVADSALAAAVICLSGSRSVYLPLPSLVALMSSLSLTRASKSFICHSKIDQTSIPRFFTPFKPLINWVKSEITCKRNMHKTVFNGLACLNMQNTCV